MEQKKKTRIRKILEEIVGWVFLLIGVLGLFLPFLQGIIFIIFGIIILSATYPKLEIWIEDQFKKGESRHPKIRSFLSKVEKIYRKLVTVLKVKETV
jgi:uncharacterized membrane protein YbaN (DUF454 family)